MLLGVDEVVDEVDVEGPWDVVVVLESEVVEVDVVLVEVVVESGDVVDVGEEVVESPYDTGDGVLVVVVVSPESVVVLRGTLVVVSIPLMLTLVPNPPFALIVVTTAFGHKFPTPRPIKKAPNIP